LKRATAHLDPGGVEQRYLSVNKEKRETEPVAGTQSADESLEGAGVVSEPQDAEDDVAVADLAGQIEELAVMRDSLAAENAELTEQLLRRQADFDNFRRRIENERADFTRYAAMETVGELLPLLDDFERALAAAPQTEGPESEFVKGIEIIYKGFLAILEKVGLEPIESVGKPFDPNHQHAVETVVTDESDDHTVIEEYRKGYNFKGKLLREAMVKVSVRASESTEATDSE